MTTGGIIAIAFLLVVVAFVIRGSRGHRGRSDRDHHDSWQGSNDGGAEGGGGGD